MTNSIKTKAKFAAELQDICNKLQARLQDLEIEVFENTGTKIKFSIGVNDYTMFPFSEYGDWEIRVLYSTGRKSAKSSNVQRRVTAATVVEDYFGPMMGTVLNFNKAIEKKKAAAVIAATPVPATATPITPAEIALQGAETSVLDN